MGGYLGIMWHVQRRGCCEADTVTEHPSSSVKVEKIISACWWIGLEQAGQGFQLRRGSMMVVE